MQLNTITLCLYINIALVIIDPDNIVGISMYKCDLQNWPLTRLLKKLRGKVRVLLLS